MKRKQTVPPQENRTRRGGQTWRPEDGAPWQGQADWDNDSHSYDPAQGASRSAQQGYYARYAAADPYDGRSESVAEPYPYAGGPSYAVDAYQDQAAYYQEAEYDPSYEQGGRQNQFWSENEADAQRRRPNTPVIVGLLTVVAVALIALGFLAIRMSSRKRANTMVTAPVISNSQQQLAAVTTPAPTLPAPTTASTTTAMATESTAPTEPSYDPNSLEGKVQALLKETNDSTQNWGPGTYQIGSDLPAGYYCLISEKTGGSFNYSIKDSAGVALAGSSGVNREYFRLDDGGSFSFDSGRLYKEENALPVPGKDALPEGMYSLGIDLEAGNYSIVPLDSSKAASYEILSDCSHVTDEEIKEQRQIPTEITLQLADVGYLRLKNAKLILNGKYSPQLRRLMVQRSLIPPEEGPPTEASSVPGNSETISQPTQPEPAATPAPTPEPTPESTPEPTSAPTTTPAPTPAPSAADNDAAVKKAKDILTAQSLSRTKLVQQLKAAGFTDQAAQYGADNSGADWKQQALAAANIYIKSGTPYSSGALYQILSSPSGEAFTEGETTYALQNLIVNWVNQAKKAAQLYLNQGKSKDDVIQLLLRDGFSQEEINFALSGGA